MPVHNPLNARRANDSFSEKLGLIAYLVTLIYFVGSYIGKQFIVVCIRLAYKSAALRPLGRYFAAKSQELSILT